MAIRGINTVVSVQATLSAGETITNISAQSEGVVTCTNTYSAGDIVVLSGLNAMPQLEGLACRIKTVSGSGFTLEGVDTSAMGAVVTSGTSKKVATWNTFDTLTQVSLPNAEPNRLDATTMHDSVRQEQFGLAGNVTGSMSGHFKPTDTAVTNVRNASITGTPRAFKMTFENNNVAVFNADVAGGMGFEMSQNAIGTASYSLTIKKRVTFYAS